MIKAIETIYDGYKFRSRLEARWAVFFNAMGWEYKYEPEGFVLDDGVAYLPDFYLPDLHTWIEVKPDDILEDDLKKCASLSKDIGGDFNVIIVNGLPAPRQYTCFCNGIEIDGATLSSYIRQKGWEHPYVSGDWEKEDYICFEKAKMSRFEHNQKG